MSLLHLHDITSNEQAVAYFIGELHDGTTLPTKIREKVDFRKGRFIVALPEDTDFAALPGFDNPGYLQFRHRGAPTLAHIVKAFLAEPRTTVLLQDTQVLPGDPWLQEYKFGRYTVAYENEIYWQICDPTLSEEDITGVVYSASFYPFGGFFSVSVIPSMTAKLVDKDLDEIVNTLVGLAVGAFDEDSFLLWWNDRVPFPVPLASN